MGDTAQPVRLKAPGADGLFRASFLTGAITATLGANSTLLSMRWLEAIKAFLLYRLEVSAVVSGAITTAVPMQLELILASAWSAADSAQTAATLTGLNFKKRAAHASTLIQANQLRIAGTAGITAGTRTLRSHAQGSVVFGSGQAVGTMLPKIALFSARAEEDHPIVIDPAASAALATGFIVRNGLAGPADGTFQLAFDLTWAEKSLPSFKLGDAP